MHFNDRSKTAIMVIVNDTYSSPVEQDGSVRTVSKPGSNGLRLQVPQPMTPHITGKYHGSGKMTEHLLFEALRQINIGLKLPLALVNCPRNIDNQHD